MIRKLNKDKDFNLTLLKEQNSFKEKTKQKIQETKEEIKKKVNNLEQTIKKENVEEEQEEYRFDVFYHSQCSKFFKTE